MTGDPQYLGGGGEKKKKITIQRNRSAIATNGKDVKNREGVRKGNRKRKICPSNLVERRCCWALVKQGIT